MNRSVARTLSAVLVFQVGIGVLLVLGDMRQGPISLPGFRPDAPRLSEPGRTSSSISRPTALSSRPTRTTGTGHRR